MSLLLACALALTRQSEPIRSKSLPPLTERQIGWWRDAKFGMFIHWGLYAIPAKGEWYMNQAHVPAEEYRKLADQFNPTAYDPKEWVKIARDAGMKYMVLTARHHDGFALWDSRYSVDGFTSKTSAAHRDLVREYVAACRKGKMPVGLYYSLMDWRIPGYYKPRELPDSADELKRQCYGQVTELTHNYGPIDVLWYDGGWLNMQGTDADAAWLWEPVALNRIVRKANPHTVVNPRSGWEGDFDCAEGGAHITGPIRPRAWEKCHNLNQVTWGFNTQQNLMSSDQVVTMLVDTAVRDGNMLLNVGPDADGVIPPAHVERLREIGGWLKKYGESIYNTRGGPLQPVDGEYGTTHRGNMIYLHAYNCFNGKTLGLPPLDHPIKKATVLTGGKAEVHQTKFAITISLSGLTQDGPDTIIRLQL
jgi:alpha-L-fucosidase